MHGTDQATPLDDANDLLKQAGEQLQSVMEERDSAVDQLQQARQMIEQLESAAQIAAERIRRTTAERDQFARTLVNVEQELTRRSAPNESVEYELRQRLNEAAARALRLDSELDAIRRTLSWRLSAPLRSLENRRRSRSAR